MRLDSPFVLALGGTLAIHLIFVVVVDAVTVVNPYRPPPPAPRIDLVEVEVPPAPPKPPPPPVEEPKPEPKALPPEAPKEAPKQPPKQRVARRSEPAATPSITEPPPPAIDDTPSGGDEVVQMEDIAPAARGVAVKAGKRNTGHVGRGGSGGGTGAGSGTGTGNETPPPVSVATIKKAAMPKGDYSYSGTDYPPEAKQLGIEGPIRVRLIVDDKGKVKQATLLNRLGHGLDELALTRAKQIEFEPARDTDDRAVTSVVVWTFHMTLPK